MTAEVMMTEGAPAAARDWIADRRSFALAWGVPVAALIGAIWIVPPAKTLVWIAALVWMGSTCLINARRCGRTHCYFTGPFFLVMAVVVLLHGFAIMPLGDAGWRWIGVATGAGVGGLWLVSERVLGRYRRR